MAEQSKTNATEKMGVEDPYEYYKYSMAEIKKLAENAKDETVKLKALECLAKTSLRFYR